MTFAIEVTLHGCSERLARISRTRCAKRSWRADARGRFGVSPWGPSAAIVEQRFLDPERIRRRPVAQMADDQPQERGRAPAEGRRRRREGTPRIISEAPVQTEQELRVDRQPLGVISARIHTEAPVRIARVMENRDGAVGDDGRALLVRDADGGARERDGGTVADLPRRLEVLVVGRGVEASERYRGIAPEQPLVRTRGAASRRRSASDSMRSNLLPKNPLRGHS